MNSQAEIDARIEILTRELASLRRKRNSLSSLCKLPVDVMVYVFQHTQYNYTSDASGVDDPFKHLFEYQRNGGDRSWICLMSSCSYLRDIAVAAGQLWRDFSVPGNVQWRNLCLARAQGCLPILRYKRPAAGDANLPTGHDSGWSQFPRALEACLTLALTPDNIPTQSTQYIYHQASSYLQRLDMGTVLIQLDNKLLGGVSESLMTLSIAIDHIDSWPKFPNLANLRVLWFKTYLPPNQRSLWIDEMNQLMIWLESTPRLEVLRLSWEYFDILMDAKLRCAAL